MNEQINDMLDRVEKLRRKAGITKAALYAASNTSSSAFSQWRSGLTKPSSKSLSNLAEVLNTSVEFLMFGIENAETSGEKKEPSQEQGGLTATEAELIRLFREASPETRQAMLRLLRSLEADRLLQGAD